PGGYAEFVKVPAQNLIPIPDHIDFVQAAAFPLTFLTAWHMLVTCARVRRGEGRARAGGRQRGGAGGHPGGPAARRARVRNGRVGRQARTRAGSWRIGGDPSP